MKNKDFIVLFVLSLFFLGCKNEKSEPETKTDEEQVETVKIDPLEELKDVDNMLSQLAEKPQHYSAPSNKKTIVKGKSGTVIHVDPNRLETIDGSPLGENLDIELVEMVDMASLMFNNTQTVSNGEVIETGGAYYLNMTSDGKQLKMKAGKGIKVEYPILSEKDMEVFMGDRDSLGQVNWKPVQANFERKNIPKAKYPGENYVRVVYDNKPSESSKEALKKWKAQKKQNEEERKTYEAIEMMDFGLCNVDRFIDDPNPKIDIQYIVENKEFNGARVYAFFSDINSIISTPYWEGYEKIFLKDIPTGKEIKIIALANKDETPYVFEKTINSSKDKKVRIDFKETTLLAIKEKAKGLKGFE